MKNVLVITIMMLIFTCIAYVFWKEEFRYLLDIENSVELYDPENYMLLKDVGINIGEKPVFVHFFDPNCKYSVINIEHISSIFTSYSHDIDLYLVINADALDEGHELIEKHNLPKSTKVLMDPDGAISSICGVNSTPRAVIFNTDNSLYFEGNYTNGFTFCGANNIKQSIPAQALNFKLKGLSLPLYPLVSGYRCEL